MAPTRRQILQATTCGVAAGLAGCAPSNQPTAPVDLAASQVPVGGGIVLPDSPLVVTQPSAGEYRAFSALCTHAGCKVRDVRPDGIFCGCHGSVFAIKDGSVVRGPATTPLPAVKVTASGDTLTLG